MSIESRTVSLPTTARTSVPGPETTKRSPSLWPAWNRDADHWIKARNSGGQCPRIND
jgi:hypothetical protein